MVVLPHTNRVLWVDEVGGATYYSDDYGTTWALLANFGPFIDVSGGTYTYTGAAITIATDASGQLLWCGRSTLGVVDLRVSVDGGASWTLTSTLSDVERAQVVTQPDGTIGLVYIDDTNFDVYYVALPTASATISALSTVQVLDSGSSGATSAFLECAVGAEPDGTLWVFGAFIAAGAWVRVEWRCSYDGGATWNETIAGFSSPFGANAVLLSTDTITGASTSYWNSFVMAPAMGSMWLAVGADNASTAGTMVLRLGGWQAPYFERGLIAADTRPSRDPRFRMAFDPDTGGDCYVQLLPAGPFATTASSLILVGAGSEALDDQSLRWIVGTGFTYNASATLNPSRTEGDDVFFRYKLSTIFTESAKLGVRFESTTREFVIYHEHDNFRVFDLDAGAQIGATITITDSAYVEIEGHLDDSTGVVTLLYIDRGADPTGTLWTKTTRTLTGSHGALGGCTVQIGFITATAVSSTIARVWWRYFMCYVNPDTTNLATGALGEGRDGWGRPFSGQYGYPIPDIYDADNDLVGYATVRGGPIQRPDTYTLDVAPDYPIEAAVFPDIDSSPESKWRSSTKGVAQDIVFELSPQDGTRQESLLAGSTTWLILAHRTNFRLLEVLGDTGTGTFAVLDVLDLAQGFETMPYSRAGRTVRPTAGNTGARYINTGELRGGHVIFDPTGTPKIRKIAHNTGGLWDDVDNRATLFLDGIDGTEPTSGNFRIVWPSGVMALHFAAGTTYDRIMLRVSASNVVAEDYFEAGILAPFGFRPTGKQWARNWEWEKTPNTRVEEDSRRVERRTQVGENQRAITLSWDDSFNMKHTRGDADPDYVGPSGFGPLVGRDDVWPTLFEWLDLSAGASRPVLWCGSVPDDGITLTDPTLWLYGYLRPQAARVQNALGEEGVDEYLRASGIQVREAL